MEDITCPRCKTTKFQNPSMKMMVNICGHALCESCVDLLFLKGSGACPECRQPLRRINFRLQLFEDSTVEKEVDIRRRILRDYTKHEEDFHTLAEYNDYLEEIETIVHNLANNIDVVEMNRRIEQYKRDNREQIQRSRGRLGRDEYELDEILEWEREQTEQRRHDQIVEEVTSKQQRLKNKEALIDELMFSNVDAKNIVETFVQQQQKLTLTTKTEETTTSNNNPPQKHMQFSTGVQFGAGIGTGFLPLPTPATDGSYSFIYRHPVVRLDGPKPPIKEVILQGGYTVHVRRETDQERAGGFAAPLACARALQDAFSGLFHSVKRHNSA